TSLSLDMLLKLDKAIDELGGDMSLSDCEATCLYRLRAKIKIHTFYGPYSYGGWKIGNAEASINNLIGENKQKQLGYTQRTQSTSTEKKLHLEENQEQGKQSSNKENKATSHTPLIDHHYKTYHHRQFQIHHHLAFCCPIGRMIVNTWVLSREELQSRNSTKNITADHNFSQIITIKKLYSAQIKRDMEAKEGEKKGGTKGKIVTNYASCIIHYIKQAETWQNMLNSIILEQCLQLEKAHCNMLVTQAFFEDQEIEDIIEAKNTRKINIDQEDHAIIGERHASSLALR
ncbi:hypothetical protein ACJX0J_037074, partial [Zea mays]